MYHPLLFPDLRQMLQEDDRDGLREFCEVLHPAVTAEVLEGLPAEDVWRVLSNCGLERQVEIFEFMSVAQQFELVQDVDRKRLSRLLEAMSPDDRVDLLERMNPDRVENILPLIAQAERNDIKKLLSYPDESAGAIMTTEYAWLPEDITVREALDRLRKQAPDRETIYYVYIVDEGRRLHGFISLRELILARPDAKLAEIMTKDVISVRVDDDQEDVAAQLAKYDFLAIPVVDDQNRLVGIVTHDDVLDIVREEADEDAYLQSAVGPLEDSYLDTPVWIIARKRGMWLALLLVAALFTASILERYNTVSKEDTWLIWFVPLILGCGGNAGSQAATLIIRALALRDIVAFGRIRVAGRELLAAVTLAAFLGMLGFGLAWMFVSAKQAAVVGTSVLLVVTMTSTLGALLPIAFKQLGMDPALMSNPLIAVMSDILALLVYFNVAVVMLRAFS